VIGERDDAGCRFRSRDALGDAEGDGAAAVAHAGEVLQNLLALRLSGEVKGLRYVEVLVLDRSSLKPRPEPLGWRCHAESAS
jgi:hypothetical protein